MLAPKNITVNKKKAFKTLLLIFVALFSVYLFGKLFFFEKTFFIVSSSSMEPEYPVGTFIIADKTPFKSISVGDVIIYKSDALDGGFAFHRVTRITEKGIYTKGDMNDFEDNQLIVVESYVAKGIYKNYELGRFILVVKSPFGFIAFLVFPCLTVILLYQVIKFMRKKSYEKY